MQTRARDDELVMTLIDLALDRPPAEREAYLRSACASDSELFEEVWKYVVAEQRMDGFLLEPLYSPAAAEQHFEPGRLLDGRFRIVRQVAEGGMGVVYEALDEKLERRIAIKSAKPGFRKQLPPEVRHASTISHPNVCKIFEIHTAATERGEIDFLTMEFLDGETLKERLTRAPLPQAEARTIAYQLCAGLAEAHRNGVIHGDLKSNNVILGTATDGCLRAVITDFGLARRPETTLETIQSGSIGGTPDYMAPELWKGEKKSVASDLYALGVILYEMIAGHRPFGPATSWGRAQTLSTQTPPSCATPWEHRLTRKPPPVDANWDRVLLRCLDPDPARRFASADELAVALNPHSRRWIWAAAAAALLAIVSGLALYHGAYASKEMVRLAVLPFDTNAADRALSDGLANDTAERLRHVRGGPKQRFVVLSLADAVRNKVDKPEKAVGRLGATHILAGKLRRDGHRILVHASVSDAQTQLPLKEWQAEYQPDGLPEMPVALAGMVTAALRLPPLATMATVSAAAYADFSMGMGLLQRNDADGALRFLQKAVEADPSSPLTHSRLAEARAWKFRRSHDPQELEQAQASLNRAEQLNPDLALVRLVSGEVNELAGLYEKAQEDLQRAREIEPQNGDVWRSLGDVYQEVGQFPKALSAYRKAVDVQPGYFRNYQALCRLYSDQGDFEEAVRQCRRMVELVPDLSEAHFYLSAPYLAAGGYSQAEHELLTAVNLDQTSSNAFHALALALVYQGRYWEAIPHLQHALTIGPKTELLYLNLGRTLAMASLSAQATEVYQQGVALAKKELEQNPRDRTVRSHLAYMYARLGERSLAEFEAAQAWRLAPGSVEVARMVVLTYDALGEHEKALNLAETLPDDVLRRLSRSPDLAELRNDPRFKELIRSHHIQ